VAKKILADDLVSVTENGVRGKQAELDDNEPAPAGTRYEPTDYKVTFLDADTAIMTHGTKGAEAHQSARLVAQGRKLEGRRYLDDAGCGQVVPDLTRTGSAPRDQAGKSSVDLRIFTRERAQIAIDPTNGPAVTRVPARDGRTES
jgi:hypothetical protein